MLSKERAFRYPTPVFSIVVHTAELAAPMVLDITHGHLDFALELAREVRTGG